MAEEQKPLMKKPDAVKKPENSQQLQDVTVQGSEPVMEREWDGPLWKMCGDCDQAGLSTFAYVKLCSPLAWGHNYKRAFGQGFWKHAVIFLLLISVWGWAFTASSSRLGAACGPHPPHPPHDPMPKPLPRPEEKQPLHTDPEQQTFLAGATLNPNLVEPPKEEKEGTWITVEGSEEKTETTPGQQQPNQNLDNSLSQNRDIMAQLQDAKNQAAENMAQFGIGRKMLHKHHHDDDDDDDDDEHHHHEHKHDGKKDGHKHDHKKEHKEDEGRPDDFNAPECHDAAMKHAAVCFAMAISMVIAIVYTTRVRTAIRMKHGIKGTKCQDCLAWSFCTPCALCQESRTLARHNVHDGVWYGETMLSAQPVASAQTPLQAPKHMEAPTKPL